MNQKKPNFVELTGFEAVEKVLLRYARIHGQKDRQLDPKLIAEALEVLQCKEKTNNHPCF